MTVEQARAAGLLGRRRVEPVTSRARDVKVEREAGRRGALQGVCMVTGQPVYGGETMVRKHMREDHPGRGCRIETWVGGYVPPGREVWGHG